ncbi:MAG: hypothetical protein MUF72_22795 [Elainella sp. Prado103]|jgi:hypothetical protein|nr:hypothetical protein [Elainella sp. Prado103]
MVSITKTDHSMQQASLVFESIVPIDQEIAFQKWHYNLRRAAEQFQGYIRTDLCPPVKSDQIKWYSIMHFRSADDLNNWLKSDVREMLIEEGKHFVKHYQFKSFTTGLEGWFSQSKGDQVGLGAPAWKLNLAIILGLYPTVMLQSILFAKLGWLQDWSLARSMLVSNVLCTSILTWWVMPSITKMLDFWLQPAYRKLPRQTNFVGLMLIILPLLLLMVWFEQLAV